MARKLGWKIASFAILGAILGTAGCATASGPPPCTPEWVAYRRDAVFATFAKGHGAEIASLLEMKDKLAAGSEGKSSTLQMIQLAAVAPKVGRLVEDFVDTAAPEVNRAIGMCGGPQKTSLLFAQMLRSEGADEKTIEWVQTLGQVIEGWNEERK